MMCVRACAMRAYAAPCLSPALNENVTLSRYSKIADNNNNSSQALRNIVQIQSTLFNRCFSCCCYIHFVRSANASNDKSTQMYYSYSCHIRAFVCAKTQLREENHNQNNRKNINKKRVRIETDIVDARLYCEIVMRF